MVVAKGLDATAAKDPATGNPQGQSPPPGFHQQPQRQSQIREMYHGREPAELL